MRNRASEGLMRMVSSFGAVAVVGEVTGVGGQVLTRVYMCSKRGTGATDRVSRLQVQAYAGLPEDEGGEGGVLLEDHGAP